MTEIVGDRLKRFREMRQMSQLQLAEHLGVTQPRVSQFEGATKISIQNALQLAKVLGVTLDDIFVPPSNNNAERVALCNMVSSAAYESTLSQAAIENLIIFIRGFS